MAKDNITLLTEITGQLRKLNQNSVRDTLREREMQERQESIMMGQPQVEDSGPAFINAAEDFKRRIKGSVSGALVAEKFSASGIRARRSNKEAALETASMEAAKKSVVEEGDSADYIFDIYNLLKDHFGYIKKSDANDRRSNDENRLEKSEFAPGMHPNSMANRIKKGWNNSPEEDATRKKFKSKTWPALILGAALTAVSMSISDIIRGWKMDGLDGAISSWLGGSEEGSLGNAIRQAFVLGAQGAALGFMIGGPVGALVGGILGMAVGAFTGWIGAGKINEWMDEAGRNITDGWNEAKGNFLNLASNIGLWFYRPGTPGRGGSGGGTKTKIMGGFISWDPGKFSIGAAWDEAMKNIWKFVTDIGTWFWDEDNKTLFGGSLAMPKWMFDVKQDAEKVWHAVADFGLMIKNAVISMLPDTFTDHMGWTVNGKIPGANLYIPGNTDKETGEWKESSVGGTANERLKRNFYTGLLEIKKLKELNDGKKIDEDKFVDLWKRGDSDRFEYDGELQGISSVGTNRANNLRLSDLPTSVYNAGGTAPVVITGNDSSSTESNVTINIEKILGNNLGSGNNPHSLMGDDGFIYSF